MGINREKKNLTEKINGQLAVINGAYTTRERALTEKILLCEGVRESL